MARQKMSQNDPLKPDLQLLVKLGSLIVHYEEATGPNGHYFDRNTIDDITKHADVQEWFDGMRKMALLPVKR